VIIKNTIKDIVAIDISSRSMALSDFNTAAVSKNIEDSFFRKYEIDIRSILGGKFYRINTSGELKFAIDDGKESTSNIDDMKAYLKDNYRIEMKSDGKEFLFKHPEDHKYIRGCVLGKEYGAKMIFKNFTKKKINGKTDKKDFNTSRKNTDRPLKEKNKGRNKLKGICMER
jgi:hypothetical protein